MQTHRVNVSAAGHTLLPHRPMQHRPMQHRTPVRRQHAQVTRALLPDVDATTLAYAGLGLGGASFVATFFVAPMFKDSFKEEVEWRDIFNSLQAAGVKQVDAKEAYAKAKSGGAVLLDVRLMNKYQAGHAAGSLSVPLYNPIQKFDLPSLIRRAGFAFFGIYGTELNTDFAAEAQRRIPRGKQVFVICENGGSLVNKSGTKYGFQSRSLKAIYFLQQAGIKNVAYVQGGIAQWAREKLPLEDGPESELALATRGGSSRSSRDDDDGDDDDDSEGGLRVGGLRLPQLASVFSR